MVAISILCWSRTFFSSVFCLRMLFILNCRMFWLFVSSVDLLPYVICGLLFVVVFAFELMKCIGCLVHALSSLVFCLCTIARCFVNVAFKCICVLSDVDQTLLWVSVHGIVLARKDPCERMMVLLHEGHMYFVCDPGLFCMSPAIANSVGRAHSATEPPAHVAAVRGPLAKKATGGEDFLWGQGWSCWRGIPSPQI